MLRLMSLQGSRCNPNPGAKSPGFIVKGHFPRLEPLRRQTEVQIIDIHHMLIDSVDID